MTSGFFIGQSDLDKIISSMEKKFEESVLKLEEKMRQTPMTRTETAKYLKCSTDNVDKNWRHLSHLIGGTRYWYADEIENYIKKR